MNQKELLKTLIWNRENINLICDLLDEATTAELEKQELPDEYQIMGMALKEHSDEDRNKLIEMTANLILITELTSFKAGVDYAMTLLGHDPVFDILDGETEKDA